MRACLPPPKLVYKQSLRSKLRRLGLQRDLDHEMEAHAKTFSVKILIQLHPENSTELVEVQEPPTVTQSENHFQCKLEEDQEFLGAPPEEKVKTIKTKTNSTELTPMAKSHPRFPQDQDQATGKPGNEIS